MPTAITGATIFDGEGGRIDNGTIVLVDGRIEAVGGADTPIPAGATRIDGAGRWVTPGVIDVHSHLGDYPSPGVEAHSDGNEIDLPGPARSLGRAQRLAAGPGLFAGRSPMAASPRCRSCPARPICSAAAASPCATCPARTVQGMRFPGAPRGLKIACGENPKRVYGNRNQMPQTRMGNVALMRQTWQRAARICASAARRDPNTARDLALDTLVEALEGRILVHNHCYRADEMAIMLDMAREFGFRIAAFHHAVEAYKIADLLRGSGHLRGDVGRLVGLQDGGL